MLACWEWKWGLKGDMIYLDKQGEHLPRREECQMRSAWMERGVQTRWRTREKWYKNWTNRSREVLIGIEEGRFRIKSAAWQAMMHRMKLSSANPGREAPMQFEWYQSKPISAKIRGDEQRKIYGSDGCELRSTAGDWKAPIAVKQHRNRGADVRSVGGFLGAARQTEVCQWGFSSVHRFGGVLK